LLSTDNGSAARGLVAVIPPAAYPQVASIGWNRLDWDSTVTKNPAGKDNAAMAKGAQVYSGATLPAASNGVPPYALCDQLAFLHAALEGKKPTVKNLSAGVDALGKSFVSAAAIGPVTFAKGKHDGAGSVQNFVIDAASKTAVPKGGLVALKAG